MQTTEGYALRTRVIRGSQHMFSMKKKQQQQQDFPVTREPKLCCIATPSHPPTAPPPPNMSTYPRIHLSNGVCSKVAEHF